MKHSNIVVVFVSGLCGCLTGCVDLRESQAVEGDFGNSARSLIQAQTANPATLTAPSAMPVTGVDPDYANNVVEAMREDVGEAKDVQRPIVMRVGTEGM